MAKSLEQGFETFLGKINPLPSEQDKAKKHKDRAKSSLYTNFECYELKETGSFGNGTGVRHYSDTDYFAICPAKKLTDNSATMLRKVREALQNTFHSTSGIEVNAPAVKIPLGTYASETMEITPCSFERMVDTTVGKYPVYSMPDLNGGWMKSSPQAHNAYVKKQDIRLNGKLKPFIQLIKAWKFYNNVPIRSFYFEMRATKWAEGESTITYDIDIQRFIRHLNDIQLASIIDPLSISGYIYPCTSDAKKTDALSKLKTGLSRSEKANEYREKDLDKAFYWWDMFYNNEFPAR